MEQPPKNLSVPPASSAAISRTMKGNRSKGTKPEAMFTRMVWAAGGKGYRKHYRRLPGNPDLAFNKAKIAVFFHGCFWHLCPHCSAKRDLVPTLNRDYWEPKLRGNVQRFEHHREQLERLGYRVLVIWGCEFKREPEAVARSVADAVQRSRPPDPVPRHLALTE